MGVIVIRRNNISLLVQADFSFDGFVFYFNAVYAVSLAVIGNTVHVQGKGVLSIIYCITVCGIYLFYKV